jgi:uncharacterized protein
MFLLSGDYWEVRKTKEKGNGVFAKKGLIAGTVIGDYLGMVVKTEEYDLDEDRHGLYLMYYDDQTCVYPDLSKPGIHLLNHSCAPNCWMYIYHGHTLFYAIRDINSDEELTISYLLSPKDEMCDPCPHICLCGHVCCRGTMHMPKKAYKIWDQFQGRLRKETKPLLAVVGEELPRLSSYPNRLPVNERITSLSNPSHNLL